MPGKQSGGTLALLGSILPWDNSSSDEVVALPWADANVQSLATLDNPWAMAFLPDGRLLITEKSGNHGAVLDCNLGGEEVWPVAEMLLDNGVPFIFSTGRSLAEEIESRFPGIPVLTKPYTARTLETTLLPELEAGAGIPGRQREHLLGLAKPLAAEARYSRTNPLFKAARLPGG